MSDHNAESIALLKAILQSLERQEMHIANIAEFIRDAQRGRDVHEQAMKDIQRVADQTRQKTR